MLVAKILATKFGSVPDCFKSPVMLNACVCDFKLCKLFTKVHFRGDEPPLPPANFNEWFSSFQVTLMLKLCEPYTKVFMKELQQINLGKWLATFQVHPMLNVWGVTQDIINHLPKFGIHNSAHLRCHHIHSHLPDSPLYKSPLLRSAWWSHEGWFQWVCARKT